MVSVRHSILAAAAFLLFAGPVLAGTGTEDGTLGSTSTGTSYIDVDIPQQVQITSMVDVGGTIDATQLASGASYGGNVCVYSNVGTTREYTVTATGDGTAGAFTVQDGGTSTLAYSVLFNDSIGGGGSSLTSGTASDPFAAGAGTTTTNCGGSANASYTVSFSSTDLQAALAGEYTGVLTLLVSPSVP